MKESEIRVGRGLKDVFLTIAEPSAFARGRGKHTILLEPAEAIALGCELIEKAKEVLE